MSPRKQLFDALIKFFTRNKTLLEQSNLDEFDKIPEEWRSKAAWLLTEAASLLVCGRQSDKELAQEFDKISVEKTVALGLKTHVKELNNVWIPTSKKLPSLYENYVNSNENSLEAEFKFSLCARLVRCIFATCIDVWSISKLLEVLPFEDVKATDKFFYHIDELYDEIEDRQKNPFLEMSHKLKLPDMVREKLHPRYLEEEPWFLMPRAFA